MHIDLDSLQLDQRIRDAFLTYDRSLTGGAAASDITNRMYDCLRQAAKDTGMDPIYEVHAWHPHSKAMQGPCWGVAWEAGPYQWAIAASFLIIDLTGRLAEPHHSFDLCFYEAE